MELEFKTLTMMKSRRSPGKILDQVSEGQAFIIERERYLIKQETCLCP